MPEFGTWSKNQITKFIYSVDLHKVYNKSVIKKQNDKIDEILIIASGTFEIL